MIDSKNSTLQNVSLIFKENPIQNVKSTCKNTLMNVMKDYSSIYEEIHKNDVNPKILINKNDEYDMLFKEKEKLLFDIMYVDGGIQFTNTKIDAKKEQINEIEKLIQEAFIKLKELEYEKDTIHAKRKTKHKAFQRATKYYKTLLDLYIHVARTEDISDATVCYFTQNLDDTYSFVISKNDKDNKWTLISVKPNLDGFQFTALQKRFNDSNNISALFNTVRKIFMMYKNSRK